jgi:hypothetical protein
MNGGDYRIDIVIENSLPVGVDPDTVRAILGRLQEFLPAGAKVAYTKSDPATNSVEFVAVIPAGAPSDAFRILRAAMEHLEVDVRLEHGLDPLGPQAVCRRACLTYEPHWTTAEEGQRDALDDVDVAAD